MISSENLDVTGYRDAPVPHTFFRQGEKTGHLAILLPGMGYTAFMPLLYYPMRLLLALGTDVLRVEYMYVWNKDYGTLSPAEQARWLFTDVDAACRAALAQRPYRQVTLVGKSLGTMAMGYLITTQPELAQAQTIWLTPLLWNDHLRTQILQVKPRSLFVSGTADPHYDGDYLTELNAATRGQMVVVEGANHSLEIAGDVPGSLRAMAQVIHAMQVFLGEGQSTATTG